MIRIIWSKKAFNELNNLPQLIAKRIVKKVNKLLSEDSSLDIKRLVGVQFYRLRVGDYRVIFDLQKNEGKIVILKVCHRKNIYKEI